MNISELRQRLEAGETIKYSIWTFSATQMSCCECFDDIECCATGFASVDEAIDAINDFSVNHWGEFLSGEEYYQKTYGK
jgi:hypothetical protein